MRILNEFIIPKEEDVEVKESSTNDKGEKIEVTKTVKKTVNKEFVLKKPNRSLYDEAELFYGVKLSEGIKAGLLTRALLAKRFNNDGGVLSDGEKDKFASMYMGLFEKQARLQKLELKRQKDLTKEEQKEKESIIEELGSYREEIQEFEMAQASLFDQTAENRARNKTILWWVLHLSYEKTGEDTYEEVFKGTDFDERLAAYDAYEEKEDEYLDEILKKFSYITSFWFVTKAETKEQLDALLATADDDIMNSNEPQEEEIVTDPPKENLEESPKDKVELKEEGPKKKGRPKKAAPKTEVEEESPKV